MTDYADLEKTLRERAEWLAHLRKSARSAAVSDDERLARKAADAISALTKQVEARDKALKRLASSEAFEQSRWIDPDRDAELVARMNYARDFLSRASDAENSGT